jgi:hypothetical protein
MKRARFAALVIALLTVTGLALMLTPLAPTQAAHATPRLTSVRMVVFDCPAQPALVRPTTLIVTCADGGVQFDKLAWTSWTPRLASAAGALEENDCIPYCAAGHFHAYPALVILWGNQAVKNHPGEHRYTMMTTILTGARPSHAPVTQTIPLAVS